MSKVSFEDLFAGSEEGRTRLAHAIENDLMAVLVPVFKKYEDQGVPVRLLCYLAGSAASTIESVVLAERHYPPTEE